MFWQHEDDMGPLATMADAHREWHSNTGVPMGTPGCPQDACHNWEDEYTETPTVKCGNRKAHTTWDRDLGTGYHYTAAEVRECFTATGRFTAPTSISVPVTPRGPSWATIPVGERGFGFYALEGTEGAVAFYRVERSPEGKWAGRTFVKQYASDALYPVSDYAPVLNRIAADPQEAGMRYARESTRCTRCNRRLTDLDSRARGMGPYCWSKGGW